MSEQFEQEFSKAEEEINEGRNKELNKFKVFVIIQFNCTLYMITLSLSQAMLGERSKNKLIEAETTLVVETAAVKKAEIIIPKVTVSTEMSAEEKVCLLVHA